MWLICRSNLFMKGQLLLMQAPCGLMATGAIVAEDMYIIADTGQGQEWAALMYAVRGNIRPGVTGGIEEVGGSPPAP